MSEGGTPRPRGRPRAAAIRSSAHPGLRRGDPLETLPPAARWILQCARRLLVDRGFEALTLEAVAAEAQETKASIQRYFGGKAGLVEVLFDSLVHDAYTTVRQRAMERPPGEDRVRVYLEGMLGIEGDVEAWRAFYEIVPHALRDPDLRRRTAGMYEWYRELTRQTCGLDRATPPAAADRDALATLILAVVDGIALQVVLDPDTFDPGPAFDLLFRLVRRHLAAE